MSYSLKVYITVMYPETGIWIEVTYFKKIAQRQDSHIQNPMELGTLVILVMFALYANEQIY